MSALVQHFGDTADGLRPCGRCDFCSPERAAAQTFRPPTAQENRQLRSILEALDSGMAKATGKLHGDLALGIDRKQFDSYLDALTRAGLIAVTADAFTNSEGTLIHFKRASLTHEGRTLSGSDSLNALLKDIETQKSTRGTSKPRRSEKKATSQKTDSTAAYTPEQKDLDARLRDWRKAEAAGNGRPSFLVLTDATLSNVVFARPTSIAQLLDVSGIGQEKADRFGAAICAICDSRTAPGEYGAPAASHSAATEPKLSTKSPTRVVRTEDTPSSDETFHRQRATTTAPAESLTAEQQQLDQRLRDWRKDASEAMGIPQFFILGSSTLRSIVLTRPRNIAQLRSITGLGPEKVEKYGTSICEICNA